MAMDNQYYTDLSRNAGGDSRLLLQDQHPHTCYMDTVVQGNTGDDGAQQSKLCRSASKASSTQRENLAETSTDITTNIDDKANFSSILADMKEEDTTNENRSSSVHGHSTHPNRNRRNRVRRTFSPEWEDKFSLSSDDEGIPSAGDDWAPSTDDDCSSVSSIGTSDLNDSEAQNCVPSDDKSVTFPIPNQSSANFDDQSQLVNMVSFSCEEEEMSGLSESELQCDLSSLQTRDINQPGIYIRKMTKSTKSSKAQAARKKPGNDRVYDNFHPCLYCGEMRHHIKTHLEMHKDIPEVKQLLAKKNPDIARIRKLGDHKHNKQVIKDGKGQIILSRRSDTNLDVTRYGPCIKCKEWVLLKNLKKHVTKCSNRKIKISLRHLIIQSLVEAGIISKVPSKFMLNEVFPCMKLDDIEQLAKSDICIIALGESWLRSSIDNREKRKYAIQHMRLMAKLLVQIRKLDTSSSNKELAAYLVPQHFDLIVAAALVCCVPFMDDVEDFQSPSHGIRIKHDLQRMLTARWAMLVKEDPHCLLAKEVQTCQKLVKMEWTDKIVKLSCAVLLKRSLSMKTELHVPSPEDIQKLTQFITDELRTTTFSAENYTKIVTLAHARLLVYNKCCSGALEAIRLENYASKTQNMDEMDKLLINNLTMVEMHLLKSQELMKVRGKGNRLVVPVLIPVDTIKPLDYISSAAARREAGIPESNVYLFPNSGLGHARAYASLKSLCDECLLAYPGRITSVSMRKYTATLTQMLNLDLDWVCRHFGHLSDVHKAGYRQMSGLVERVHFTKLLLLQDLNLTKKFKGQSLDEIGISDIVFPDSGKCDTDDGDPLLDTVVEHIAQTERDDEPVDTIVFDDSEDEEEFEDEAPPKKKTVISRQRWDETEMKEIHKYFKLHLYSKITPRSREVNSAKKSSKAKGGKIWSRTTDKIVKKISAMNHKTNN